MHLDRKSEQSELEAYQRLKFACKEREFLENVTNQIYSVKRSLNYLGNNIDSLPTIYVVCKVNLNNVLTELADLSRLKNTLRLVPKLVLILIENSANKTTKLQKFSSESGLNIVHLNIQTTKSIDAFNYAILWLRSNNESLDRAGVVYFAYTQATFDVNLFDEVLNIYSLSFLMLKLKYCIRAKDEKHKECVRVASCFCKPSALFKTSLYKQ